MLSLSWTNGIILDTKSQVPESANRLSFNNALLMKNLEYKGYSGSIEYNKEDNLLFGKVLGIKGFISYEGETGHKLEIDFKEAIDTYINDCKQSSVTPEKPFKGSFNVRISPRLHRKAALLAREEKTSLNNFVEESIRQRISKETGPQY